MRESTTLKPLKKPRATKRILRTSSLKGKPVKTATIIPFQQKLEQDTTSFGLLAVAMAEGHLVRPKLTTKLIELASTLLFLNDAIYVAKKTATVTHSEEQQEAKELLQQMRSLLLEDEQRPLLERQFRTSFQKIEKNLIKWRETYLSALLLQESTADRFNTVLFGADELQKQLIYRMNNILMGIVVFACSLTPGVGYDLVHSLLMLLQQYVPYLVEQRLQATWQMIFFQSRGKSIIGRDAWELQLYEIIYQIVNTQELIATGKSLAIDDRTSKKVITAEECALLMRKISLYSLSVSLTVTTQDIEKAVKEVIDALQDYSPTPARRNASDLLNKLVLKQSF